MACVKNHAHKMLVIFYALNSLFMNKKQTSANVASKASAILRNPKSTPSQKSVAASYLAQTKGKAKR